MTYIPCAECGSSCGPNHWVRLALPLCVSFGCRELLQEQAQNEQVGGIRLVQLISVRHSITALPLMQGGAFDPRTSNTSERVGCDSPKCICGSPRCGCAASTCTYTRSYAEHSSSSGATTSVCNGDRVMLGPRCAPPPSWCRRCV